MFFSQKLITEFPLEFVGCHFSLDAERKTTLTLSGFFRSFSPLTLGDKKLDVLLCTVVDNTTKVTFFNRSLARGLPWEDSSDHHLILSTNGSRCNIQALDFDEDGDVDLILDQDEGDPHRSNWYDVWDTIYQPRFGRYFERISFEEVVERTGEENPLGIFDGKVQWVGDMDGDGRLELIVAGRGRGSHGGTSTPLRFFRRAADDSFVEEEENPFAKHAMTTAYVDIHWCVHLADWNSDGLVDLLVSYAYLDDEGAYSEPLLWRINYFQHVLDRGLTRNSHMDGSCQLADG